MKYSILVPLHDKEKRLWPMTIRCLNSIVENSRFADYELLIEDGYTHKKVSYTNELWKRAKGDYLILVGNDVVIKDNLWLEKLAIPDAITSFKEHKAHFDREPYLDFAILCIPRYLLDKIGLLDEQFADGYGYDDNDWCHRARLLNVTQRVVQINAIHEENQTYSSYFTPEQKFALQETNFKLYQKKWQK